MKAQNLKLTFGNEIIYDDASFEIKGNSKVGIVGVNGAGKTTLFKIIMGELELDEGNVFLENRRIGYLPQEIEFDMKDMSVWDYIYGGRPITLLISLISGLSVGVKTNISHLSISSSSISYLVENTTLFVCIVPSMLLEGIKLNINSV